MERLPFLLLLLLCVGLAGSSAVDLHKRIIGGKVCQPGESPHHVKVIARDANGDSYICGGSLITKQWILTAAHCYEPKMYAILGLNLAPKKDRQTGEIEVESFRHENHDIMLLKLPKSYDYPIIRPPGPQGCQRPAPGDKVKVSGHGQYQLDRDKNITGPPSTSLRCVEMEVVKCQFTEDPGMPHDKLFCGKMMDNNGKVTCNGCGDSGGGVVYNNKLHGIVKGGHTCFLDKTCMDEFVDVCQYIDWINKKIKDIWK